MKRERPSVAPPPVRVEVPAAPTAPSVADWIKEHLSAAPSKPAPLPHKQQLRDIARKALLLTRESETQYIASLRSVFSELHAGFVDALMQHAGIGRVRVDAKDDGVDADVDVGWMQLGTAAASIEVHFLTQVPRAVGRAFDKMVPGLVKSTREVSTLMGISPSEQGIAETVATAREASIRLVEDAGREYAADVRAVFTNPANWDLNVDTLRKLLMQRGTVSMARADLIARDQVLKLSAAMNEQRQRNAGIEKYEWSGIMDERERESHVRLEGRVFAWGEQTPIGYAPGEDYQCRCIAIAHVPT